jgi:protein-disulfide isomerase
MTAVATSSSIVLAGNVSAAARLVAVFVAATSLACGACKPAQKATGMASDGTAAGVELAPAPSLPAGATTTSEPALPSVVNTSDLDVTERRVLGEILAEQFDPCGKSRSFLEALQAGDCRIAPKLARIAVDLLRQGQSKKQTVVHLLREIERLNTVVQIDVSGAPLRGAADAKVVVVAFSDFECPYCRRAAAPLEQLRQQYGFALYYRHFPLKLSHPNAEGAARAAWAAHQQGKFWPLHDLLFANAHSLDWPSVRKLAGQAGLDEKRFVADFESKQSTDSVSADVQIGHNAGVDGTPTYFVNGRKAETLIQLQDLVRETLAQFGLPVPPVLEPDALGEGPSAPTPTAAAVQPSVATSESTR